MEPKTIWREYHKDIIDDLVARHEETKRQSGDGMGRTPETMMPEIDEDDDAEGET